MFIVIDRFQEDYPVILVDQNTDSPRLFDNYNDALDIAHEECQNGLVVDLNQQ